MSICNECCGKGWIEKQGVQFDCRKCKGTGVIENEPQTNEEWLRQATTEQLAEVLFSWYKLGRLDVINKHTEVKKDWLIEWLKQPHIVKE